MLDYTNHTDNCKRCKAQRYYLPKGVSKNYIVIISGKTFHGPTIDSDIKCYKEIRKLKTGQREDYDTACLSDYDYIKNYYRLIGFDLSRQNEVDPGPRAIQQTEQLDN